MVYKVENKQEFEAQMKAAGDKLLVVDFYATWCGPCKRIAPFLEKLADTHKDKMIVIKVDVDENEELSSKYKIDVMPTFIFIRKGEQIDKVTGSSEPKLEDAIKKNLA